MMNQGHSSTWDEQVNWLYTQGHTCWATVRALPEVERVALQRQWAAVPRNQKRGMIMMNEVETAALAVLVDAHGVGDVLLALSHLCAESSKRVTGKKAARFAYGTQVCQQAAGFAAACPHGAL
jgi:hypothetical protein